MLAPAPAPVPQVENTPTPQVERAPVSEVENTPTPQVERAPTVPVDDTLTPTPVAPNESAVNDAEQFGLQEGMLYAEAREVLIEQGWEPHTQGAEPNLNDATVSELFDLGYEEIKDCSGTGVGPCRFEFMNDAGELLVVSTAKMGASSNQDRVIWSWFIEELIDATQEESSS
ncbi:MAG: hypothetical protein AAGF95_09275 [Chloroflexota bacterium]